MVEGEARPSLKAEVMAAQGLWVGRDMERRRDLMQLFPKDKNLDAILC